MNTKPESPFLCLKEWGFFVLMFFAQEGNDFVDRFEELREKVLPLLLPYVRRMAVLVRSRAEGQH